MSPHEPPAVAMLAATPCRMIPDQFLGPTDHRGSRVKAWSVGAGARKGFTFTVPWDHAEGSSENHETAAKVLYRSLHNDWSMVRAYCCSEDGGGYVFAFVREAT